MSISASNIPLPKLDLIAVPGGISGRNGELGRHHVLREQSPFDPREIVGDDEANVFSRSRRTKLRISGLAIWSRWRGGITSGSTRDLPPGWEQSARIILTRNGRSGFVRMPTNSAQCTSMRSQPLIRSSRPVKTESEADSAIDEITYQKGQSFLRMLESYLGEEDFRAGIRSYMQAHRVF